MKQVPCDANHAFEHTFRSVQQNRQDKFGECLHEVDLYLSMSLRPEAEIC